MLFNCPKWRFKKKGILLSESEKHFYQRSFTKKGNYSLNLFRITQTESKLKKIILKNANNTHYEVGQK